MEMAGKFCSSPNSLLVQHHFLKGKKKEHTYIPLSNFIHVVMSPTIPHKKGNTRAKAEVNRMTNDSVPAEPPASKKCPKPQPLGVTAADDAPPENGDSAHAPPSRSQPVHAHKPTATTLKVTVPKQPSKKALAAQAKQQKEEVKKNIQAIAVYEEKIKEMGFEETPLPPPPVYAHTASGSKRIPQITGTLDAIKKNVGTTNVDDNGVEDFLAEINEISEGNESNDEGRALWPGFQQCTKDVEMEMEPEQDDEENGPLYNMDVLTSEPDIFMSSPSGKSDDFVLPSEEEERSVSDSEDVEETPVVRKREVMKGKGKVKPADARIILGKAPKPQKQTKGMLLRGQIATAWDHLTLDEISCDCGNAPSDGHAGVAKSEPS